MKITEAQLKHSVSEYLEYGQNQGKWMSLRLNSGDYIETRGTTRRRVKGCAKGTSDLMVIMKTKIPAYPTHVWVEAARIIFIELKSNTGKVSEAQGEFGKLAEFHGSEYYVVRSLEELQEIVG